MREGSKSYNRLGRDAMEVKIVIKPETASAYGLKIKASDDGRRAINIDVEDNKLYVEGVSVSLEHLLKEDNTLTLEIFLDHSILEVFVNEGLACVTRKIQYWQRDMGFQIYSSGGTTMIESMEVWDIKQVR